MKKFFALLTALVLCATLFVGAAMAEDENLASAKGLLDFWYKNKSRDKLTQTAEDYEVPAQLMIDGVAYPLTWSVDTDAIQITPAEDGKYLVDIDETNPKDLVYTLTATVTAPDGSTLDVPYERMVPAAVLATASRTSWSRATASTRSSVVNRMQQRNARPGENGTRPGGAVQTKIDVSHMSRKEMEEIEKRAMRGEVITL